MAYTYSTGSDTWTTWTCSTSATTSNDTTWYYWTGDSTATTSTVDYTWGVWNDPTVIYQQGPLQAKPIVYTKEQLAEQKAQAERLAAFRAEEERKAKEREKKEAEAREKSKQLLISLLDKQQAEDFLKKGHFGFVSDSGKVYTIKQGIAGNVIQQDGDKKTRLCCHVKDNVPVYDNMASQLIWLKFCEEEFVKLANKTRI